MTDVLAQSRARTAISVAVVLGGAFFQSAAAVDLDYQIDLGLGHSDNIRRTAEDQQDEDIASAGLRFSMAQNSPRTQADVVGNFVYSDYLDDTYDSEVLGNLVGNARFALVPEKFTWIVADSFGQVLSDPFAPLTPDNRENVNYLTTGPDITLAFGSKTAARLGGRYALATYEDRPLDFDSVGGELALIRQLSAASSLSLNGRYTDVRYDESALQADYEQSDAFVRYDASGVRTHLAVDLGYSEIRREATDESEDDIMFHLDASRRLTASSTATLRLGREFSNSATAFATSQSVALPDASMQTAQPFTHDFATLGYAFERQRNRFSLAGSWSKQSHEQDVLPDQKIASVTALFSRNLSQRLSWGVSTTYMKSTFEMLNTGYEDMQAGTSLLWQLSRHVSLTAKYDYFDRSSDLPAGEYTENRFWLAISYGRGLPRETLAPPQFPVDQRP